MDPVMSSTHGNPLQREMAADDPKRDSAPWHTGATNRDEDTGIAAQSSVAAPCAGTEKRARQ